MTDPAARYLARIGLDDPVPATPEGLARLQAAQLDTIPFEGIDPFLGLTPRLETKALLAKIVDQGRGGYCYELNTALGIGLAAAGLPARRLLARVRLRNPAPGPRSHMAWLVDAGGRTWLADAGFGGPAPRAPLPLAPGEHAAPNGRYRFTADAATGERVLERHEPDGWAPLYSFDGAHVTEAEVEAANHVSATWDRSPFTSNLMLAGWDGPVRIGLFNRGLTEDGPAGAQRRELATADDLAALFARLRLRVDTDLTARLWERLA